VGEGFAVDASLIKADGRIEGDKGLPSSPTGCRIDFGVLTPEQDESPNGRDEGKRHQDYSQRRQRHQ
jgi:hypothetical protein